MGTRWSSGVNGVWQTPGGHPAYFTYRDHTNDWNTLSSTMNDEYRIPVLSGVAVDVGGYLGSVGIGLALDNPDLRVWIIEPVPPNGDLIEENIAANSVGDRVTLIRGAVGRGSVDVGFAYRGNETVEHHQFVGNSNLATDEEHETVTYRAITLRTMLKTTGPIDLMKIDTEGAEWDFLGSTALPDVHTVVGEWHPVKGHTGADLAALMPSHDVTLEGEHGFRAVRR